MSRLRFAFNTNGLAHHRLDDAIDLLADLGYDGLALTPDVGHLDPFRTSPGRIEAVRAHLERRGLGCCIQTGARYVLDPRRKHFPTLIEHAPEDRARRVDFLTRCIEMGHLLGAEVVAFWSGRAPTGASDAEVETRLVDGCRRVADAAAARGMLAAFEPEPGMHVETVAQWDQLAARVDHPAFRLALDVGHVHCNREGDAAELARSHAGVLADVQIEDMREGEHLHLPFGEGTFDPGPVVRILKKIAFDGLVGVELSRDSHRAPHVAAASLQVLRALESAC